MGIVSCLGNRVDDFFESLLQSRSGIQSFPEWKQLVGQKSCVGGAVREFSTEDIPRSIRRSMSRMSEMAYHASRQALHQADLAIGPNSDLSRCLLILGSTTGSPQGYQDFFKKYFEKGGPEGQLSTAFLKTMNHSVAANVGMALPWTGPILSPSSACTTSSQALILGWELLQTGMYDVVLAGGADELHPNSAGVFDIVYAASTKFNDQPELTPRPFDKNRDGLAVAEGAGMLVLETEAHLLARKGRPLAEFMGGAYICDGTHMTHAQVPAMAKVMQMALNRSKLKSQEIDYVNAHATGTVVGDLEEIRATREVFGPEIKVSSLKGHMGHSLAACGAMELIASIAMLQNKKLIGTRNLEEIDPDCALVQHLQKNTDFAPKRILSNNFAFGGVNSSLVISAV